MSPTRNFALSGTLMSALVMSCFVHAAEAAEPVDVTQLKAQLDLERTALAKQRAELDAQRQALDAQQRRIDALSTDLLSAMRATGVGPGAASQQLAQDTPAPPPAGVERVGEAPDDKRQPPQIAVLGDQGSIITKRGRITIEPSFEYTHADSNRALFRGIELVESVLVGVFDINEIRQDALTAAIAARYGVTDRLEVSARLPFVHRADRTVLAPVFGSGNPPGSGAGTQDFPARADNIGDVEASVRYQLNNGQNGWPFLIANIQAVIPTGTNPFSVARDVSGAPTEAATGSGFWGVSPTLTAILPTDPAVLFATLGYTRNFGRHENARIGGSQIDYVKPGDALLTTVGIGLSLNDRTSINMGYAHTWAFGTTTTLRVERTGSPGQITLSDPIATTSRQLQLGRYLFGVTYRVSDKTTFNWAIEVGATRDAPAVHTTLRIPITF